MRTITLWAFRHKTATRFAIAAIQLYLLATAMMLAGYWQKSETAIPVNWMLMVAIVSSLVAAVLHYWVKAKGWGGWHAIGYTVVRIKYLLVVVAAFTALLTWFYTNSHIRYTGATQLRGSFVKMEPKKTQKPEWKNYSDELQYYNDLQQYYKTLSRKQLLAELKATKKMNKQGNGEGGNAGWVILIILGALVATYLVLVLSCSISCAGSEAGAIVVAVLGLAGIILGTIALLKRIKRKSLERAKNTPPDTEAQQ